MGLIPGWGIKIRQAVLYSQSFLKKKKNTIAQHIKDSTSSAGDTGDVGSNLGSGKCPGRGNVSPLQYSCQEIPCTEEPGGLQFMGSQTVGHD